MVLPVYPNTPAPADYDREPVWAVEGTRYETGVGQFSTTFHRPLYSYNLVYQNAQDDRRKQIEDFWNDRKSGTLPFLWTDPKTEHHYVGSIQTGYFVTSRQGRFYDVNSWRVIPMSGSFTFHSVLSGALTHGIHWSFSQDNGFFTVFTTAINSNDAYWWHGTYGKKVHFDKAFKPKSRLWGNYNFVVSFYEVLP